MKCDDELVALLPTKWSRWTAGSSILLSISAYNLPSALPLSGQAIVPLTLFFIKLSLSIFVLLLGSWIVLFLVIRHFNSLQAKLDSQEKLHETTIAEIKAATDPINNLKPGEALIAENLYGGNPVITKVNLPS